MPPHLSLANPPNSRIADVEISGDLIGSLSRREAVSNNRNVGFCQFRVAIIASDGIVETGFDAVMHIAQRRNPFEVLQAVVCFISVLMVHLKGGPRARGWLTKGFQHKLMYDSLPTRFVRVGQAYQHVPLVLSNRDRPCGVAGLLCAHCVEEYLFTTNLPIVRNFVAWMSGHGSPSSHGAMLPAHGGGV